jgi:hypothetical protein
MGNESKYEEWYFQSDYDLETAFDMFHSGRYVYCIFMSRIKKTKEIQSWIKQQ